ncbi:1-phosphofructokinase [Mycolicibacterium conceptionense]|jgi:1-phosphofructokinase|uniref:1-phosphofructokinase n=2 Tax=Mycolicibacterium TaxID=1866885 RepID=A0ABR5FXP1_9MYCO|nr:MULTISPECIES: 1-phosphofructokinase family hexose kinase [Mycolicibacterium]KLI05695.1 1-phosphofructokinase [Mycolicibacterium senegalense]KLO52735.1 1-phosphofructokinase [Mycolicibacterium senegalense]KMV18155.1 1-phosphofructokinase [Mycolicibacterium conceptionense]OMB86952.1 1-phosphofructokinase [Mycolicibacterium conceptionense]QZH61961.1 1-phosphofructokinase family hexose kinase [Mycolicibacterium farcinogenes]
MIVTVTPNPSLDRTVTLGSPLLRGAVQRIDSVTVEPGGKGINVARALTLAGVPAEAVLPAADSDPLLSALRALAVPFTGVPLAEPVRTNIAITESDGTTTKLNERGAVVDGEALAALTRCVLAKAQDASWVVMSGSLPPGMPLDWYAQLVALLAPLNCRVAVDTSEAPLAALAAAFEVAAPDLIKPNAEELADLAGVSAVELESAACQGDPSPVVAAAGQLVGRGVGAVLATLGAAGAVLVDNTGAWLATPPPIVPRSTVGAGDASLAGYLRAAVTGADAPRRLQMAVAYGSAAAALPGSALPGPAQLDLEAVHTHPLKVSS